MSCNTDVKKAAVDKIFKKMVDNRFTFSRRGMDVIVINGKQDHNLTKAENRTQARQIALAMKRTIAKEYNKKIQAFLIDEAGKPIVLKVYVADDYVDAIIEKQPEKQRDYVNTSTGPNTYTQINMFAAPNVALGVFEKYVQFKKQQLSGYKARLSAVKAEQKDTTKTTAELTKLKAEERRITAIIEGDDVAGTLGLKREIDELIGESDIAAIAPYVKQDFARMEKLANSNDMNDLEEVEKLIRFYELAGRFERNMYMDGHPVSNPFFSEAEMFHVDQNGKPTNVYKVDQATRDQYTAWAAEAVRLKNIKDAKYTAKMVDTVNSNPDVVKTYGANKVFTERELTSADRGLKDADWISAWTMDITHGIFSNNGLLPQVGFSTLYREYNKAQVMVREYNEKMDEINPKVIKRLRELNHTLASKGIVGIQGISYQIFKEVTKEGNETNGLVQRFTKEYGDEYDRVKYAFDIKKNKAAKIADPLARGNALNKAFETLKKWRRENSIIIDITKITKIANDPEFATVKAIGDATYEKTLIDILGQRGFEEAVDAQIKLLRNFQSERQSRIDAMLVMRNKQTYADLSATDQNTIQFWTTTNDPAKGVEDYNSVTGITFGAQKVNNWMNYNSFIARKYKPAIKADIANNKYDITDTTDETGHYSKAFAEIEKDPILSQFYYLVRDGLQNIREAMPPELQEKIPQHTILTMQKTSAEIALDNNTPLLMRLFPAFKDLWDKLRQSFGVTAQSEMSYANIDATTGLPNYKINDEFFKGNLKELRQLMIIENTKFLQAYNSSKSSNNQLDNITRRTVIDLADMNESSILALAGYLHVSITSAEIRAGQLDKIKNRVYKSTDNNGNVKYLVEIGKFIRDFSMHTMVQSQSFDLAKLMKYHHNLAQIYAAKQKALPVLKIVKNHYEKIQQPGTNNVSVQTTNGYTGEPTKEGPRERAVKQFEDWFQRVILGNVGIKHSGMLGYKNNEKALFGNTIYSNAERAKLNEINALIAKEPAQVSDGAGGLVDNPRLKQLEDIKKGLGKTRTWTAALDNFLEWIKVLRLGYSLSSMSTNFMEGVISNMMVGSTDEFFDPKELYFGYGAVKHSFLKNLSFGRAETATACKVRSFADRHNVIVDSSNELQRSSHETYSDKMAWMNPHAGNQRTEFINQTPLMIAMLRTVKIKDKSGKESSVWNATDKNGHLLPAFVGVGTNSENWDDLTGDDYLTYKSRLGELIVKAHGNYDELRGMMAKGNTAGKALMMFKTWIPQQLAWRFGEEQPDIMSGRQVTKGTYRSMNKGTAALYGAAVGFGVLGPLGAAIGAGTALGTVWLGLQGDHFGTNTQIGILKETIESARLLAKKMLGLPVNFISGVVASKQLIDTNKKSIIGKGGDYFDSGYTKVDQNNLKKCMTDIALQLDFLLLIILAKALLWDDDDDKDAAERQAHNVIVNKLMQLSGQAHSYTNPTDIYKSTVGSMAVMQYFADLLKEVERINKAVHGKDRIGSGVNAGESGLWNQSKKILMPGIFKDGNPLVSIVQGEFPKFGFSSQTDKQFLPSPFDDWFKSAEKKDAEENKGDRSDKRSTLKKELKIENYEGETPEEQEKNRDKDIRKQLDELLPTPTKLKKIGMTREEYKKYLAGE